MAKNYTVIADLMTKNNIEDNNLIIVEDAEDTKQSTIEELKKCFLGDYSSNPSERTFYSTKRIENILDNLRRQLSTYASNEEVKKLQHRVAQLVAYSGTEKDSEIIDARDDSVSLGTRLRRDLNYNEDKYMKKVRKFIEGTNDISTENTGYVDIYPIKLKDNTTKTNILFKSKNILDISRNTDTIQVKYTSTGFKYSQTVIEDMSVTLKFVDSIPKGTYFFFANVDYDAIFKDKGNIIFAVSNTKDESAYTEFTFNQTGKFKFEAPKAFNQIKLIFNSKNYVTNATVEYSNIMLTRSEKYGDRYIAYENLSAQIKKDEYIRRFNRNYDISCVDKDTIIRVEYYDNSTTAEWLQEDVDELKATMLSSRDKCGLIKNYGEYLFFNNAICETPTSCRLSFNEKYKRNGVSSLQLTFQEDVNVNPLFALELSTYIENIDSTSIVFYIDKDISYYFTSSTPITIYLCSDSYKEPEMVNYAMVKINKKELVQGWNIIKKGINDFTLVGKPNIHAIKYVKIEVDKNSGLDNKTMYFNSVIFNQKMKPTVLLAFDGIYDESIDYTYPYLAARGVPATILANNRTTFSSAALGKVEEMRAKYGWDIGQYGCNPNKGILTRDDNSREQYLGLKMTREWLQSNLVYNPISYSAPFGNLRPITVPLLKDFGFKIAKTDANGYCNFFDPKYDFAIPTVLMSNDTTEDEIKQKIKYAIDNDCCICLYTNNVTEYGDESSAKKVLLENVVKYLLDNKDNITMMTFSEFYNECTTGNSVELKDRVRKSSDFSNIPDISPDPDEWKTAVEKLLIDFEYIKNDDGTCELTEWKRTYNGQPSTKCVIPDHNKIII